MRVAHIITRMIIGGAQENTLFNCLDLAGEHGDEVLLITGPAIGPEGDLLSQNGLDQSKTDQQSRTDQDKQSRAGRFEISKQAHLRRAIHPWHDLKAARSIRQTLRDFKPDVVHTHSAKGGLLGRKVAWGLGVPAVVHTVHGAPFHPFQNPLSREFFRRCERWAAGQCHHLVCVADAMTDLMVDANVAPREKFTTIYSGMDVDPFLAADDHRSEVRRRFGFEDHHVVIGKIARLFHLKGHDDLITAAARVVAANPNVRFLLVGDGILRQELTQQISELGLAEHFVFSGLVPPTEVPAMIGAMDALVHTSLREGLARALPQALIAGRPVVSYDVDGAREVAINDETGYLIPPRQIGRLAEALGRLASDAELRHRLGGEGQRRFTDRFRHQTMTREIRALYERILG